MVRNRNKFFETHNVYKILRARVYSMYGGRATYSRCSFEHTHFSHKSNYKKKQHLHQTANILNLNIYNKNVKC